MKNIFSASAALLLALSAPARAGQAITAIPEVGPHYKVVTVEKSVHPQNKLVAYTRLDQQCRVVTDPRQGGRPVFDFYWLMDGLRYKRVHPLIKRGIRKRLTVGAAPPKSDGRVFSIRLNDLSAVENDLGRTPLLWVAAKKTADGCAVEARITLGPSNKGAVLLLDSIYSEAVLKGPAGAKIKLIALKGTDAVSGKRVVRVYRAK